MVAVKEATSNMARVTEIRQLVGERFALLAGDDLTMLPFLAAGGQGVISVSANLVPRKVRALIQAARAGDYRAAGALNDELAPLHLALAEGNPVPVKAALAPAGPLRRRAAPAAAAGRPRDPRAPGPGPGPADLTPNR